MSKTFENNSIQKKMFNIYNFVVTLKWKEELKLNVYAHI